MKEEVQKIVDQLPPAGSKPVFVRLTAGEFQQALRELGVDAKHSLSIGVSGLSPDLNVRQMSDAWEKLLTEKGVLNGPAQPE